MKVRIVFGKKAVEYYQSEKDLKNIGNASHCLVQGDASVRVIEEGRHVRLLVFGWILGPEQNGETLSPMSEGRFIAIRLGPDNACEVFCDRYGQRDLYYQTFEDGFVLASDLSLLPFKDTKVAYDPVAVAHSIYIYGFRPAKRHTFYKGVQRLGVGESARWENNHLSLEADSPPIVPFQEYGKRDLSRYSELLLEAVAKRSSPHGNIVYLSSGWDSTALLACLVKLHGAKKVRALISRLTMSQQTGLTNPFEVERARKFTDYFGVSLETVDADWSQRGPDILERLQPMMRSHMFSGMSLYNWIVMAEYVAKTSHGEAVFSGEISDGAHNLGFSQFTTFFHPVLEFREYSDKMSSYLFGPTFLQSLQEGTFEKDVIYNLLKQKYKNGIFDLPCRKPVECARQLLASFFLRDIRIPLWSLKNNRALTEWGRQLYAEEMESIYIPAADEALTPETLYSWYLHLYNSFHWQGGTVSTLGATAEEYGFEMHLPFWDSRLQGFLAAMPESWGRGLEIRPTKYPLKWMLENVVDYPLHFQTGPHSYLYDIHPNFNHAAEFVFRSSFTPLIQKALQQRRYQALLSPEVFDYGYFDQVVDHYLKGQEVVSERNDLASLAFLSLTGWYS